MTSSVNRNPSGSDRPSDLRQAAQFLGDRAESSVSPTDLYNHATPPPCCILSKWDTAIKQVHSIWFFLKYSAFLKIGVWLDHSCGKKNPE